MHMHYARLMCCYWYIFITFLEYILIYIGWVQKFVPNFNKYYWCCIFFKGDILIIWTWNFRFVLIELWERILKMIERNLMFYEFKKGVTVETALNNITRVYQGRGPQFDTVWKWYKISICNFSLEDLSPTCVWSSNVVHNLVNTNPRISVKEIAEKLNIDQWTVCQYLNLKKIGCNEKCNICMLHKYTGK